MKLSKRVLELQLIAGAFATTGCGASPDAESIQEASDEPVAEVTSAFQNSLTFVNCGDPNGDPIRTIRDFASKLSNRIYASGGEKMRDCLNDSFLSYVNNAEWGGDIWYEFNRTGNTQITCASNLQTACGRGECQGSCRIGTALNWGSDGETRLSRFDGFNHISFVGGLWWTQRNRPSRNRF